MGSTQEELECIVLMSNDTDLKTPLSIARKKFKKRVGIISPYKRTHQELKKVSHFNVNITNEILKQCQFPEKVAEVTKPPSWEE